MYTAFRIVSKLEPDKNIENEPEKITLLGL